MQAHGLVERFSRGLDVATENPAPMQKIVASLTAGLGARGWRTTHVQTDPLSGRFLVTDPGTGDLESPGRRRAHDEFGLEDPRGRLIGADWYEDEDCTAYGLTSRQIEELKTWALEWAEDLGARIHDENA